MPSLLEIQQAMFGAVARRSDVELSPHVVGEGLDASLRLGVYRDTFASTLVKALRLSYPAIERLVGAEFFEGATRHFIDRHVPVSAYLDEYGAEFPEFLRAFSPAASLLYLADVARLEWAVNQALHAKDAGPLDLAGLNALPQGTQASARLTAHPSLSLLRADFPADTLWHAVLAEDDETLRKVELDSGPVWLMVCRAAQEVEVTRLGEAEWRFLARLAAGEELATVLASAEGIDAPALLASALARGAFAGFHISGKKEGARA